MENGKIINWRNEQNQFWEYLKLYYILKNTKTLKFMSFFLNVEVELDPNIPKEEEEWEPGDNVTF